MLPCWAARYHPRASPELLVTARTMTVNVHVGSSGRNCRETIASLRNARVTHHHVTNLLCCFGSQWLLRRQRYHVLTRISDCRETERAGENPDCKSDRPAAPATQSGSSSHAYDFEPAADLSKLIHQSASYFQASPLLPPVRGMFQSVQRKCSRRMLLRRALASSLRLPPAATSLS